MTIAFTVNVQNIPGASTKRVTATLANHTDTFDAELGEFDDPPSRVEFRNAARILLRAAYFAVPGTPAQRIAALEAGITRLAYKYYQTGETVNP